MPKCTTFIEFIHERYGDKLTVIFIIFAVLLCMYILLAQGMGVGIAVSYITGIPYKIAVAVPLLTVGFYIAKAGLRGSMFNDLIQFFIISSVLVIIVPVVLKNVGLGNMFDGLMDVATNPSNPNHNPGALNFFSSAGMRYGVVALVVALGQVLLDQGYYSKAVSAASTKTLLRAYLIGTIIAWAPIAIICGNVLGGAGLTMGAEVGTDLGVASDVAPYVIESFFGTGLGSIMYLMMIFMAGMTTGGGVLAGVQAISTIDLYKRYINKDATEKQQTTFGKRITVAVAIIMAVVVMFFENASLLQVDIFSGIIFAAPCGAFVAGLIWRKVSPAIAGTSIFIGMICGITAYFVIPDDQINYFVGNLCSLLIPVLVIVVASVASNYEFDWQKLKTYSPPHDVHVSTEE